MENKDEILGTFNMNFIGRHIELLLLMQISPMREEG